MTPDTPARPSEAKVFRLRFNGDYWWTRDNTDDVKLGLETTAVDRKSFTDVVAQLTEANRRLAVAREALDSITKDIQSYSGANFVVQWVLDRNVKARKALAQISAEGRDEKISDATGGA